MRKFYTSQDLLDLGIRYHPEYLRLLEKEGKFPRRVRLGGSRGGVWVREEVDKYMAARLDPASRGTYATRVMVPDTAA